MTDTTKQLETMKNEVALWICDANFWLDEVEDCQTLLEKKLDLIDEVPEKKRLEQFQNQIIYYRDELLPQLKIDLANQKEKLKNIDNLNSLEASHLALEERGTDIQKQMKERRRQLELFVNNI